MSWRTSSLAREAVANLRANGIRTVFLFVTVAAVLGSLAFLEFRQAASLAAFRASYIGAGGYVAIVSADGGLSAARCASLVHTAGVVSAGGVRPHGQATFATAPGVLFQAASVTEGTLRVWDPSWAGAAHAEPSLILGTAAAAELGVRPGLLVAEAGDGPATVEVANTAVRNPQTSRWVLDVIPASAFVDECWVEFEPAAYEGGLAALPARFTDGSKEAVIRPYMRQGEFARNPEQELHDRPQRLGWAAAAALLTGIVVLSAWFRRNELALYLALGTRRSALAIGFAVEVYVLAALGFVAGLLWSAAIARIAGYPLTPGALRLALITSGSCALLFAAAAPILCPLVARGSIAALLKDR